MAFSGFIGGLVMFAEGLIFSSSFSIGRVCELELNRQAKEDCLMGDNTLLSLVSFDAR